MGRLETNLPKLPLFNTWTRWYSLKIHMQGKWRSRRRYQQRRFSRWLCCLGSIGRQFICNRHSSSTHIFAQLRDWERHCWIYIYKLIIGLGCESGLYGSSRTARTGDNLHRVCWLWRVLEAEHVASLQGGYEELRIFYLPSRGLPNGWSEGRR
jgi:hypothetical protein